MNNLRSIKKGNLFLKGIYIIVTLSSFLVIMNNWTWLFVWLYVYVLDRGRIMDGLDSEFYIDTRPSSSDAEEA